jgi:hypothetical protein
MEKTIIRYRVTGMVCGGCLSRVKNTLAAYADSVEVTLTPPIAVLINPSVGIEILNSALAEIGQYQLIK